MQNNQYFPSRFTLVLLLVFLSSAFSWANVPYFERLSWEEGLQQNSVFCVEQDAEGFLWMGTRKGVIRYDGLHYDPIEFSEIDGVEEPIGRVSSVKMIPGGQMLILSRTGAHLYDPKTERTIKLTKWKVTLGGDAKIIVFPNENVVIASDQGLYRYLSSELFVKLHFKENNFFSSTEHCVSLVAVDGDVCLVGTNYGLATCKCNEGENSLEVLDYTRKLGPGLVLCKETTSNFWMGTANRIRRINISKSGSIEELDLSMYEGYSSVLGIRINDMLAASDGNIYAGSTWDGVFRINTTDKLIERFVHNEHSNSITWNTVFSVYEDCFNVLWFGTGQGGLTKYDTKHKRFMNNTYEYLDKSSLPHNHVSQLFFDKYGYLWAGTFQCGLNVSTTPVDYHNFEEAKFKSVDFDGNAVKNRGYSFEEFEDYLIITCADKMYFYDQKQRRLLSLPEESALAKILSASRQVISCEVDAKKRLWIGGERKCRCFDFGGDVDRLLKGEVELVKLNINNRAKKLNRKCNAILSHGNKVYIATEGGLFVAEDHDNEIQVNHYTHVTGDENSLSEDVLTNLLVGSNGDIWVGTFNRGLNRVKQDKDGQVIGFDNLFNGIDLPAITVYGMQEDEENNLWLSSFSGLYKYNVSENSYINYTRNDGLNSNLFHIYSADKNADGFVVFGGIAGVTGFDPKDISTNEIPPKVSITDLKIFNERVNIGEEYFGKKILSSSITHQDEIILPFACNVITLEFSAFHFAAPEKNTFSYMLEGVDKGWINTSIEHNFVSYNSLPPGEYVFKLTASNSDDVKNANIKELVIRILPPWYATWWAITLFLIIFIGILFSIYFYLHKLTKLSHSLELETFARENARDLFEAKQRFFMNVSHELKTPLTLIFTPLEKLKARENVSLEDQKTMGVMQKNAKRLLRLIDQIMDFRRLENGKISLSVQEYDLHLLINEIINSFQQEIDRKHIVVDFPNSDEVLKLWFDIDKIEKVIYNIFSNALKNTLFGNTISVFTEVSSTNEQLVIRIMNEGEGIPQVHKEAIFERFVQLGESSTGAGIGLSMCKSFVELHQGVIVEKGEEGENAIFEVTLPLNAQELFPHSSTAVEGRTLPPQESEDETVKDTSNKFEFSNKESILVVEDNDDMREMVCDYFSDKYEVYSADNGLKGLEKAVKCLPSIIVSDVMMPEMDGNTLCKEIKENSITSHIPIILLTAKGGVESKIEGLVAGADAYVTKPFNITHLSAQVGNLLASRKKIQEAFKEKYGLGLSNIEITSTDEQFLKKFILYLEENIAEPDLKVADAAQEMSYSYMQFNRKIKAITGDPVGHFISNFRLNRAKQIFAADPERNIAEVMYSVGFNNSSYFSKCFKKQFAVTPKEFKESHKKVKL